MCDPRDPGSHNPITGRGCYLNSARPSLLTEYGLTLSKRRLISVGTYTPHGFGLTSALFLESSLPPVGLYTWPMIKYDLNKDKITVK